MDRETDLDYLRRTIELADEAVSEGNHPFGAILVSDEGDVLCEAKTALRWI